MPWSTGLESQRGNLTSMLGTLAQMREGKKNRRSALLRDILGIGAQFGGAALQNQWAKKATQQQQQFQSLQDTIRAAREKTAGEESYARDLAAGELGFQRDKELEKMRINAGAYSRGVGGGEQEDASKLIPYDIASQAWDAWWERLQTANPKRQMNAKDFDQFRAVAVEAGSKYGFTKEQMEDAVNNLAAAYGFPTEPVKPEVQDETVVPRTRGEQEATVRSSGASMVGTGAKLAPLLGPLALPMMGAGLGMQAASEISKRGGIGGIAKGVMGKAKTALGIGQISEKTVLDALAKAKQVITPQSAPEVSQYEAEVMQAGPLPPERLQQIMDRIAQLVRPK